MKNLLCKAQGILFTHQMPIFLFFKNIHIGPARKIEVYAPLAKPTSIAKEKLCIVSPPKRKIDTIANNDVATV